MWCIVLGNFGESCLGFEDVLVDAFVGLECSLAISSRYTFCNHNKDVSLSPDSPFHSEITVPEWNTTFRNNVYI